jgi:hypothetical protein
MNDVFLDLRELSRSHSKGCMLQVRCTLTWNRMDSTSGFEAKAVVQQTDPGAIRL